MWVHKGGVHKYECTNVSAQMWVHYCEYTNVSALMWVHKCECTYFQYQSHNNGSHQNGSHQKGSHQSGSHQNENHQSRIRVTGSLPYPLWLTWTLL